MLFPNQPSPGRCPQGLKCLSALSMFWAQPMASHQSLLSPHFLTGRVSFPRSSASMCGKV